MSLPSSKPGFKSRPPQFSLDERNGSIMEKREPKVGVDILVIKNGEILLGLLTDKWDYRGKPAWGVPGNDIKFGEKIVDTLKRNVEEQLGCKVTKYEIICVNANYALGNHYIGIGATAKIDGEPKLLIPKEWKKWGWFSENEVPENLFPATKNLIECYLKGRFIVSE